MPTTTDKSTTTSNVQNIPSQMQNEAWGGLWGAMSGLLWPGGGGLMPPQYGGQLTAPQGEQTVNWYSNVNATPRPDYGGVMQGAQQLGQQGLSSMRDPSQINIQGNYTPQSFNVPQFQMQDPFSGYNGGGQGMQIQAPGGVSGNAASYQVPVQNVSADQVNAPAGVRADQVQAAQMGPIQQVSGPQLQNYQMGPAQNVNAPGGLSSFQIAQAAPLVQAGTVGTQSWTQPGTAQNYMSPYTQQVLNAQKANMTADYAAQQVAQHAQAAQAGAFGGTRQAVQDAESQRNLNLQMQNVEAQGLQQAYQQGAQQFNTEQGLGMQGQQFNVQTGLQAGLANQAMQQQTALANQQAALAAQGLGTTTGMQAALANQQAGLTTGGQNLQALLQTQGLGAQLGMQGQLANQQMSYQQQLANMQALNQASLANQGANLQAGIFNNTQALQAQGMNQSADLQAALANQQTNYQAGLAAQQMGLQGAQFNAGLGMQSQLANQQAQQAMYNRQLQGLQTQYGGNLQAGLQGQNLGMTAQQLGMQSNQFGAGLNLQGQTANEQARTAMQNANLGYLNFAGNMNQQNANYLTQGFNNQLNWNQQLGQTATNQQAYDQAAKDRAYAYWQQQQQMPFNMLQMAGNLASQFPAQGSVQSTQQGVNYQTTPGPSMWNMVGGLASTALGAFTGGLGGGMGKGLFST